MLPAQQSAEEDCWHDLCRLARRGFKPAKYFSIDRVFRNEAIDRTHLAEFHQIEGACLSHLRPQCASASSVQMHQHALSCAKHPINIKTHAMPAAGAYDGPALSCKLSTAAPVSCSVRLFGTDVAAAYSWVMVTGS